jgi:hypothetical protein
MRNVCNGEQSLATLRVTACCHLQQKYDMLKD